MLILKNRKKYIDIDEALDYSVIFFSLKSEKM